MGLLIPAVNSARETARRNQCGVNMKNLALAAVQYENTKGRLPAWVDKYGTSFRCMGDRRRDGPRQIPVLGGSQLTSRSVAGRSQCLPWLDAQPTYEHWTQDRYPFISRRQRYESRPRLRMLSGDGFHQLAAPNLAIFQCPSNPFPACTHGKNSYVSNNGMSHLYTTSGPARSPGTRIVNSGSARQSRSYAGFTASIGELILQGATTKDASQRLRPRVPSTLGRPEGRTRITMLGCSENVQALPWHRSGYSIRD